MHLHPCALRTTAASYAAALAPDGGKGVAKRLSKDIAVVSTTSMGGRLRFCAGLQPVPSAVLKLCDGILSCFSAPLVVLIPRSFCMQGRACLPPQARRSDQP